MSEELTGKIVGLMQRAESLKSDAVDYFTILVREQNYWAKENVVKTFSRFTKVLEIT